MSNDTPTEGQVDLELSVYLEHRSAELVPAAIAVGEMNPADQMPARGMLDPVEGAGAAKGEMPRPSMQ